MILDNYEKELLEEINKSDSFTSVENLQEEIHDAKLASKRFLNKTKNINIRIPEHDILKLKRKSAELNIPYQTIISSLVHQYLNDRVEAKL